MKRMLNSFALAAFLVAGTGFEYLHAQNTAVDALVFPGRVTFSARHRGEIFRVEILTATGQKLFDSGFVPAQRVDWDLRDPLGERVADGAYRYTITLTDRHGYAGPAQSGEFILERERETPSPQKGITPLQNQSQTGVNGTGTIGKIPKWTAVDTIGDSMIAESSGKIGVGTTSPAAVLHVVGTPPPPSPAGADATEVLRIVGGKGGNAAPNTPDFGGVGGSVRIQGGPGGDGGDPSRTGLGGSITLQPGGPSPFFGFVRLAPAGGRVGIGNQIPQAKLHVEGTDARATDHALILATLEPGVDGVSLGYRADGTNAVGVTVRSMSNIPLILGTGNGPNTLIIRDSNMGGVEGNVGIGTSTPGSKLTVAGMIHSLSDGFKFPDGTVQTTAASTSNSWLLTGNGGTNSKFLGTTNALPLLFVVDNTHALHFEPTVSTPNVVGGASIVAPGVVGATIGGGGFYKAFPSNIIDDRNRVTDDWGVVAGGRRNFAGDLTGTTSDHSYATVGGGVNNWASGGGATIAGGIHNTAGDLSTIGGGTDNNADFQSTIAGGGGNVADGYRAAIGGGEKNKVTGWLSTVGGGFENTITDSSSCPAAFCGGSTIAGGSFNKAGGYWATVAGGNRNEATGFHSTVGGGSSNIAGGLGSTVSGGTGNAANGAHSFAAGRNAIIAATHAGTFLFADDNANNFASSAANEFAARSTGGVRFVTAIGAAGNPTAGVSVAAGGGSWSSISDRNAKTSFASVDGHQILHRLSAIPIQTWSYKSQEASIRHIGPMAQDFAEAFRVGEDDKHITSVDADGVALAAIQSLYRDEQERDQQIVQLQRKLEEQRQEISRLLARVEGLENAISRSSHY